MKTFKHYLEAVHTTPKPVEQYELWIDTDHIGNITDDQIVEVLENICGKGNASYVGWSMRGGAIYSFKIDPPSLERVREALLTFLPIRVMFQAYRKYNKQDWVFSLHSSVKEKSGEKDA